MNNKSKLIVGLLIPVFTVSLSGCNETPTQVKGMSEDLLTKLQTGFKAKGTLKTEIGYFEDPEHFIPAENMPARNDVIEMELTYTNTKDYIGMDYKYYQLQADGTKKYIASDNMYDNQGHLFFNSVGYDNVLSSEFYATDKDQNFVAYGSNTSLNPFTLLKITDFYKSDNGYVVDKMKSSLVFNDILYNYDVTPNLNVDGLEFVFKDGVIDSIVGKSNPYYTMTSNEEKENFYTKSIYGLDLKISEVGTANAKDSVKIQPEKPENANLAIAVNNLKDATSFRVSRHFKTDYAEQEETVDLYYDGQHKAIYQQVYDSHEGPRPNQPSEADALLYDTALDLDKLLNVYSYLPLRNNPSKHAFQKGKGLGQINNVFLFEDLLLTGLNDFDANVLNKNADGSFSPIPEHLPFIATDCFVPGLCTTSEISNGMVLDFKLYLTADNQNIDRIELVTKGSTLGNVTVSFDQFGTCVIPFNALNNIVE